MPPPAHTTIIDHSTRDKIRTELADHMKEFDASAERIALIIKRHGAEIGGTVSADSIRRFLDPNDPRTVTPALVTVILSYLNWQSLRRSSDAPHATQVSVSLANPLYTFVSAMTRFFSEESKTISSSFPLDGDLKFGDRLIGDYAFYRPSWRPYVNSHRYTTEVMVSLLSVSKASGGYLMTEAQDFPQTGSSVRFQQNDRGCLIALGYYLYFLTKEREGTAVKLGLIENLLADASVTPIDWFRGILYASSHLAVYPPAKFFCRRINDPATFVAGPIDLSQVPDPDVREYLHEPLPEPLQFKSAGPKM